MTLIDFPSKPELLKRLDEVAGGWPIHASPDLGKPFGDINGSAFSNPPEEEVNDLARYKEQSWPAEIADLHAPASPAAVVLAEAVGLLEGDRAAQHGDKVALHRTMAGLFSAYLGCPIKPSEAAMLECLMKAARTKHGLLNKDDFRDGSAYFGIAWECADAGC
jgi:hypothetical protein